jgi:hypothetical protein
MLQTVLGIDNLLGVESADAHDSNRMVFERRDAFDPAVDQLNVDATATRADAAYADHSFLFVLVLFGKHCLSPVKQSILIISQQIVRPEVYPPSAAPEATRVYPPSAAASLWLVKGDQGIEG